MKKTNPLVLLITRVLLRSSQPQKFLGIAWVPLGWCSKMPRTGWLYQHLLLTVPEAEMKVPTDVVLGENPPSYLQKTVFSLWPRVVLFGDIHVGRDSASLPFFLRVFILSWVPCTHHLTSPNYLPKAPPPNSAPLENSERTQILSLYRANSASICSSLTQLPEPRDLVDSGLSCWACFRAPGRVWLHATCLLPS